ncbi:DUF1259 domain-containing protein [Chengkuizengella sediminis]|uniref:DUF1259 domain-containing protein n=1 Tax=Chengkuizengella sediminis TaxID=1885917 RepID=UPI001389F57E|nr:DUF1259 domain-containing protein [Chengkuizengella sediminis]NDI35753.1 DUF1259 domain-containing protein [Chengkuizengella sediminis]
MKIQGVDSSKVNNALAVGLDFQSLDKKGRALCLGEISLLESELTPFIRFLRNYKSIKIGSAVQLYLKSNPKVFTLTIEAVEYPVIFAKIVRESFIRANINFFPTRIGVVKKRCKRLASVFGNMFVPFCFNNFCTIRFQRSRKSKILGRLNVAFNDLLFSFTPISKTESLCLARLDLFEDEINKIVKRIQKRGFLLGNASSYFSFSSPPSSIVTYQAITNPFVFAAKSSEIVKGLNTPTT